MVLTSKFKRRLAVFVLIFGVTVTIVCAFAIPKTSDYLKDTMAIFTGGIIITTLLFNALNYILNLNIHTYKIDFDKKVEALKLITEWHSIGISRSSTNIRQFLTNDPNNQNLFQLAESSSDIRSDIISILNYLEKVSVAILYDTVNEEMIKNYLSHVLVYCWHNLTFYVHGRRQQHLDNTIFEGIENLVARWK